jgi:RNA-directed DNA polymerase
MEQAVADENYVLALAAVKRNQGAAGIDRMTTAQLQPHLQAHWWILKDKLLKGTYVPSPVRRVEIPKPSGGTRMLGIPTVQDRFIQQLLLQVLTLVFDPQFSEHSYGFRPGRSAQDAVRAAQQYAQGGEDWVVDFDIAKFFDQVNHDILMGRIARVIRDKRVLHLIGKYLRRGALVDGLVEASEEGTPQGGPLSPLLANIYLDALDKELERRGHSFCRYADDCNIYVGSQTAAERTLASIQGWIEKHLRLKVNAAKSGTGRVWERKFLGFRLDRKKRIGIAPESLERLKAKVREMWRGNQSRSCEHLRDGWGRFIRGWWGYFRLAEARQPLCDLEGWVRRHIRKCFWLRWHDRRGRERRLRRLGLKGTALGVATSNRGAWRVAAQPELHRALSNSVLRRHGFLVPSDLASP